MTTVPPEPKAGTNRQSHRPRFLERLPPVGGQLVWYAVIGGAMTLAYLGLYAVLRDPLGAQLANVVSWVLTCVADTSLNRRFTFGIFGRTGAVRAQGEGLLVFGVGLVITSGSLWVLERTVEEPSRALELWVLVVANVVAGLIRFALLRLWVFAPHRLERPTAGQRSDP